MKGPNLSNIRRVNGVADQYAVHVDVQYPNEAVESVAFVAHSSGSTVVMVTPERQVFVDRAVIERIGHTVDENWVRQFFGRDVPACDCGCVQGDYPCEYGTAGEGCGS